MSHSARTAEVLAFKPPPHQQRVDEMMAAIRAAPSARPSLFKPPPPKPTASSRPIDRRIAEELVYMSRQLEQLGGVLAGDPILLMRHAGPLQSIDAMKQVLEQLGRIMAAEDKEAVAETITLTELKGRLHPKAVRAIGGGSVAGPSGAPGNL